MGKEKLFRPAAFITREMLFVTEEPRLLYEYSQPYQGWIDKLKTTYPDLRPLYEGEASLVFSDQFESVYKEDLSLAILDFPDYHIGILYARSKSHKFSLQRPWGAIVVDKVPMWCVTITHDTVNNLLKGALDAYDRYLADLDQDRVAKKTDGWLHNFSKLFDRDKSEP